MKKILIILTLTLIVFGCENVSDVEQEIPFKEDFVIRGVLQSGKIFDGVSFTRTLPLQIEYKIELAELKNVIAYIKVDGVKVIPLNYVAGGIYKPKSSLIPEAGKTYELFASWNGKNIYAKTGVPEIPELREVKFSSIGNDENFMTAKVTLRPGEVYGSSVALYDNGVTEWESDNIHSLVGNASGGLELIRTPKIPKDYYNTPSYRSILTMHVYAFDQQYFDYFKTQNANEPIKNAFSQGGGSVIWNVRGEGIGMFIGMSDVYKR